MSGLTSSGIHPRGSHAFWTHTETYPVALLASEAFPHVLKLQLVRQALREEAAGLV